jgi:hypothetical protein
MGFAGIAKPISDAIKETKDARLQYKLNQDAISDIGKEMEDLNKRNLTNAQIRAGFGGKELKNLLAQKEALEGQNKELDKKTNKYKNIASAIKQQFTLTNMTDALLGKMVKSFKDLDEAQTKFKNLTGGQIPMMDTLNGRLITTVDYIKTAGALTEQLGMNASAVFSPDTLAAAAEMVKAMGMTQEQANQAAIMSQVTGVSIDDMNKSLKEGNKQYNQQNRSALAQGVIMREVYNTSTATAASMGNSVDRIGEAVRRAKDLGLSLKDVEGIASSLLDVESSIAAEFEYEVISGKQLNLEAARYYALTNQTDKLTKEIANNQAVISSFASGNRIEQEAAAKALGISRDQLSEMYMADLRKKGLSDKAIADAMAMDEMDVKRLTTQETINTAIAKMSELLAGPAQVLTSMIDNAWILYSVMGMIGTIAIANIFNGLVKTATQLVFNLALTGLLGKKKKQEAMATAVNTSLEAGNSAAKVPIVGPALAAVAILSIMGLAAGLMSKIGDGAFPANGKSMVSTREGGLYETSKNDDIAVGPGIINKLNSPSKPLIVNQSAPQQQSQAIDYDKMAQAMSRVKVQTNLDGVRVSSELQKAPMGMATRKI